MWIANIFAAMLGTYMVLWSLSKDLPAWVVVLNGFFAVLNAVIVIFHLIALVFPNA